MDAKISTVKAQQLYEQAANREEAHGHLSRDQEKAQLGAQKVKIEQLRGEYKLKKSQVDQLKVRAGFDGMLQALPPPGPVEVGQNVAAGTPLGKVAQPSNLKAELKIAETQVKDIAIGQPASSIRGSRRGSTA